MAYSGTLTNDNDAVTLNLPSGSATVLMQFTGNLSGTILFEASSDNVTWVSVQASQGLTIASSTTTTTGNWRASVAGYDWFRVRSHPVAGGTCTVLLSASAEVHNIAVTNPSTTPAALGQGTMAQSLPVVIASDQSAFVVNPPAPTENTFLTSASRTTTQTQADQTNAVFKGVCVILDVTIIGTGNITLEIDAKDPTSGKYYVLLTGAAVSSNTTNTYTVYPSIVNTANVSASNVLPKTWRIKVTANNANAVTYSVGYNLLP